MSDWVLVALNAELDTGIAMNLMLGDCLERMKEIPDGSVDMILADPPYGTTACKWDVIIPFDKLWEQHDRIIRPNGAVVLAASQPHTCATLLSSPRLLPMKANEDVLVVCKNKANYYPIMVKRTEKEFKECYRKNDSKS